MNQDLLVQTGLTTSQAKAYLSLIKSGATTPPDLAAEIGESRTNTYKILERLEEMGLVEQSAGSKKARYNATNPIALQKLIEGKRQTALDLEASVRSAMPQLLTYFYTYSNQPGVRFYSGKDALIQIYEDQLRTGKDVYFVRTPSDELYFGDILYKYMLKRAKLGITAHGLAPYSKQTKAYAEKNDVALKREIAWFPPDAYKSPVEVSIYGDKVSLISFGKEAIGTIIESPQIAEAFRELFIMARVGAEVLMDVPKTE